MFTALTSDKQRVSVECAATEESYFCPVCGNPVMVKAATSKNIRKHFAHRRNCLCFDNWKHDMSDWHFDWQSMFPIENREVVVENDGIYHRADILINNTVIEFQHSPIQCSEFEERNYFYKNCGYRVIWLFDATDKMKIGECFGLVWKRKNPLFTCMKTRIDGIFVQHYLPDTEDLLLISRLDPIAVDAFRTFSPIMPENFLKEYGAIQDDNVLSIQDIFYKTKELDHYFQQKQREAEERLRRRNAYAVFDYLLSTGNRRHRRF